MNFRTRVSLIAFAALAMFGGNAYGIILSIDQFTSSGPFVSVPGTYVIDTDMITMTGPDGFQTFGVIDGDVTTFTFDSFALGANADIRTTGDRLAAIRSRSTMEIGGGGIIALAGGGSGGNPRGRGEGQGGGFPGTNFFGGAGGGGGFGGTGGRGQRENPTFDFPGAGGPTYGNLENMLQGGSGGGGGKTNAGFQSAGGDGGGGLELSALFGIEISSSIVADGQQGRPLGSNHTGGGGGSGGGIILRAPSITNLGLISAIGGRGGDGVFENGGGGGGGRILIETLRDQFLNLGELSVAGGTAPSDFFGNGIPGRAGSITFGTIAVPEPGMVHLMTAMLSAVSIVRRRR